MSDLTVTKTRLLGGVWEGVVTGSGAARPAIEVMHLDKPVDGARLTEDAGNGCWVLRVPVPAEAIADGVQTILIRDAETGEALDSFSLIAGEPLAEDIRAEVDLLRAELDMLKRAFRRHCVETM
ncbi:MAG: hypothetical protein ACLFRU_07630 [Paracoccaceae bacterium]